MAYRDLVDSLQAKVDSLQAELAAREHDSTMAEISALEVANENLRRKLRQATDVAAAAKALARENAVLRREFQLVARRVVDLERELSQMSAERKDPFMFFLGVGTCALGVTMLIFVFHIIF